MAITGQTVLQALVTAYFARNNCASYNNWEWYDRWRYRIDQLMDLMPHGSGFNTGTTLLSVKDKRVEFGVEFQHMTENGYYDGWTEHTVVITPAFDGFDIRVTGRNRDGIKEYIAEAFHYILSAPAPEVPWNPAMVFDDSSEVS